MANTYQLIQAVTLTTTASTVTLGSGGTIPQTYTDLKVVMSTRCAYTGGVADLSVTVNGDSGANYQYTELGGNGSSAFSGGGTGTGKFNTIQVPNDSTSNTYNNAEIYIPNYTSSTQKFMSVDAAVENNSGTTNVQVRLQAWLWTGTSAITTLSFAAQGATNFLQYSSFYLYGIKNS